MECPIPPRLSVAVLARNDDVGVDVAAELVDGALEDHDRPPPRTPRRPSSGAPADVARFQNWMLTLWYPMDHAFLNVHMGSCSTKIWANWDLCSM